MFSIVRHARPLPVPAIAWAPTSNTSLARPLMLLSIEVFSDRPKAGKKTVTLWDLFPLFGLFVPCLFLLRPGHRHRTRRLPDPWRSRSIEVFSGRPKVCKHPNSIRFFFFHCSACSSLVCSCYCLGTGIEPVACPTPGGLVASRCFLGGRKSVNTIIQ